MPGLFGGGGGSPQVIQPVQTQQGQFQIYQPQAQQQADWNFQGLTMGPNSPLLNQAWSGLNSLPGGVSPATAIYPNYAGLAGQLAQGQGGGAYGAYGNQALQGAQVAAQYAPVLTGPAFDQINNTFLPLGNQAAQNIYNQGFDPNYGLLYSDLFNNPFFQQTLQGGQQASSIGQNAASGVSAPINAVIATALGVPGTAGLNEAGFYLSGQTGDARPTLQQLLQGQAGLADPLSQQAQALNPQLQALYGSSVPQLQQLAAGLPGQLGQTAGQGLNLFNSLAAQEQGLAGGAMAQTGQDYGQLQGLFGQSVPQMQQIAGGVGGIPQLQQGAQQIMQTGMDPQSQLFNRLQQQTADQSAVANAMSGLGSSPYGAGLTAENLSNFDINWQNQQLQRQAQALGAAGTAYGQAAGLGQTQANILGQAAATGQGLTAEQLAAQQWGANAQQGAFSEIGNLGQNYLGLQQAGQLGGAQTAGSLLQGAAGTGQALTAQQLANLTGAGNIYNQQAQGAGALGSTIGGIDAAQLQQMISGQQATTGQLQAALGLGAGATQLAGQAAAQPGQAYTQQMQTLLNALNQRNAAGAQGAAGLSALTAQQGQALQAGLAALTGQAQMRGLPYQTAATQQQNAMAALQNQLNVGNNIYQLPQQVLNDLQSYMQLGQSASAYGGQLGLAQQQLNQPNLGAIGSLLNTGLGGGSLGGLLYGSQGLGGALGLGESGLLGSLPGSAGFATATDFAGGAAGAGSGILGFLGGLLP